MKRPAQHQIDDLGESIFERKIRPLWTPQKQEDDYGIDYIVRIFSTSAGSNLATRFPEAEPTGECFAVQLKSTADIQRKGNIVTMRMETDHLVYYTDKETLPVFLVVVDVNREDAYWLFLQEYIDLQLRAGWRDQQKVTIEVPQQNIFEAGERMSQVVANARVYLAGRRSESIVQSILVQERLLEQQDPRFSVTIEASSNRITRTFCAKQEVSLSLSTHFETQKQRDKFLQGAPVAFKPGEVTVDLPMMQRELLFGGKIQVAVKEAASLSLFPSGPLRPNDVLTLPGRFTRGLGGARFKTSRDAPPLRVTMRITFESEACDSFVAAIDLDRWHGLPVLELPFFEQISSVLNSAMRSGALARFTFGSDLMPSLPFKTPYVPSVHDLLEVLRKAREISTHLKINPRLPRNFGRKHGEEIETLHALLFQGEYVGDASRKQLTTTLATMDRARALVGHVGPHPTEIKAEGKFSQEFSFLDREVHLGMTERSVTHVVLAPESLRLVRQKGKDHHQPEPQMRFLGTENSQVTMRSTKEVLGIFPKAVTHSNKPRHHP